MSSPQFSAKFTHPTPEKIKEKRGNAQLTQKQAGMLVYSTERNWQRWETGDNKMHPAIWELFLIKTNQPEPGIISDNFN